MFLGTLYASSAFYSPGFHPTMEDQVELARRISHSLSDISNKQSKGQTMYSNRKKRSVKWVHEGEGIYKKIYKIMKKNIFFFFKFLNKQNIKIYKNT